MTYVDGMVAAVPTAKRMDYLEHSKLTSAVFKKHGATSVVECWGDDVAEGKLTSFPMAVKREPDETVVFSWITWVSKQARERELMRDRCGREAVFGFFGHGVPLERNVGDV